ncbi:MAG: aminotransferase class III-fold pyridoxal phosphate-dependent enzyme [Nitrospiria bacterium]
MDMTRGIIVQARNGSRRYPQKMLHRFHGRSALAWVLSRCATIDCEYRILATTVEPEDDILADTAKKEGWHIVRGDVQDVLSRFATAVRSFKLDTVVRITGDCLLTDGAMVSDALERFIKDPVDYFTFTHMIDGFDVEVISGEALLEAARHAALPSEREHVTPWIKKAKRFRKVFADYRDEDLSWVHLSLDDREDAETIARILGRLNRSDFSYDDVAALIKRSPDLVHSGMASKVGFGNRASAEKDARWIQSRLAPPLKLDETMKHHQTVTQIIPGASQTFSKSSLQFSKGAAPLYVKAGEGAWLYDLDGNRYIDFTMGLGACILGYAFEPIVAAAVEQLHLGCSYTLPHRLEYELSKMLCEIIPCAEMVRLGKNGSDVTSAAIRVARAYTGRDKVACCGYHGWQDWYIASTTRNEGIPPDIRPLTLCFSYNRIDTLEQLFLEHPGEIACVIMEPVSLETPEGAFLEKVKALAHQHGAVLIYDEVVTGFRFSLGGSQTYFGVIPDLACFGKAMGNGLPISALVGKKEIMERFDEVFFSTTFGGETASIASAIATIKYIQEQSVTDTLWTRGEMLKTGISNLIDAKEMHHTFSIEGYPVRSFLNIKEEDTLKVKTLFQQECVRRGILFTGAHNLALPHDASMIEMTLSVYEEVFDIIRYAIAYRMIDDLIQGETLQPVFRSV